MAAKPSVLLPIAPGTNRNQDLADAFSAAGATTHQVPLEALRQGEEKLADHQILALSGGFSYGDALGAGRLLALDLRTWLKDQLLEAQANKMPIIGICNGFQALVAAELLPSWVSSLVPNVNAKFECRWVELMPTSSTSPWLTDVTEPMRCPVAHGEGRFVTSKQKKLLMSDQVALRYSRHGEPAQGEYPANPNGSVDDIAGVTDATGLTFGLMPHPENHVFRRQSPWRGRDEAGSCLPFFVSGVKAVK